MGQLVRSSDLSAPPDVVWRHATSPAGVNREFWPWMRMTFPKGAESLVDSWRPGERVFRSWLLLFGVLPVEYDDLVFEELEPGRRFLERSSMLTQRVWEHERTVEPEGTGARITDRVRWEPRLPGLGVLLGPVFRGVFWWRHRSLVRQFGAKGR